MYSYETLHAMIAAIQMETIFLQSLFGQPEDNEILPSETPVEKLPVDERQVPHSPKHIQAESTVVTQAHKSPQLSRPSPSKPLHTQAHEEKSQAVRLWSNGTLI